MAKLRLLCQAATFFLHITIECALEQPILLSSNSFLLRFIFITVNLRASFFEHVLFRSIGNRSRIRFFADLISGG
ncbi:hypothetical protein NC00_01675 [Xanthomonas cannabis pv. phaseoli]|uniref:Secreted protein n=1 Tax=Xanthomonas cannabis pv. phaseoli TaxID=1885902 RepID=A0AB34PCN6_9XANT|nr:hypothetical protein NC00_01675 [Xanthomonas cannabis pv. phaseoli]